ncbi:MULTISPECIES: retron St85 family RNA-directed DNA polymerase [unclassified Acinetobacter]|uniref:retron St85 family RNA-directed DNA polymerase n=1 Tax=unclassified Acinetobacter TaxID=196816 RepID=UPI0015D3EF18|nr:MULTISPECIES: retron St85 family RNA-directed DNA polymerase [unclassified Acinetobacter]
MKNLNLLKSLEEKFNIPQHKLEEFIQSSPRKYKVYQIPKRSSGTRTIAQPTPELKEYQRYLVSIFSPILPIHETALAYVNGKSIKDNALIHCKNRYFLKMDFSNFFNSITPNIFWKCWEESQTKLSDVDKEILTNLIFWKPSKYQKNLVLSIGAPSSPLISNFCMYKFDITLSEICRKKSISYTRYADDLTFSTECIDILFDFPLIVSEVLIDLYDGSLEINHFKTAFSSKKHNRHVTGVTITNESKISLGRKKKRYIKHLIHKFILGSIEINELTYLKGYFSFIHHIEPDFLSRLKSKYSDETIDLIRSMER